jgi:hypothetical protein
MSSLTASVIAALFQGSNEANSINLSDMQSAFGIVTKLYEAADRQGVELMLLLVGYLVYSRFAKRSKQDIPVEV